ncbi:tapasin-related protein-like [Scyliorhinus canicula]|uniref:tapasin-related protein-like n=1 Tax=Scyliorhinus canicula TaxID=7830 RepID=UPI0018F7BE63|nr:tapasin-related protein-like [Scyliorhinus canicula]XP_038677112.1 tapasin-related protein-like [Scyliorhinus canicula]XP_038677113.1 tapasin-related protein-like [Scyliorhinus canicula]
MHLHIHWLLLKLALVLADDPGARPVNEAADVVLDCWYIEDASGLSAVSGGFSREKALLVLRNVSIAGDEQTSAWTDYEVRDEDRKHIIFEVIGSEVPIPNGEILLHADCEGQEVTCEISSFEVPSGEDDAERAPGTSFIGGLRISGGGLGMTLLFRTIPVSEESGARIFNEKLNVELSPTGTIPLSVQFLVYTRTSSIRTLLGQTILLDCGFLGDDPSTISVDWRIQHKGTGRRIYTFSEGQGMSEREGTLMDANQVGSNGNVSLLLRDITVQDEGTYICIVQGHKVHSQQTISVEIMEPPRVTLTPELLYFHHGMRESLTCQISRYYPLDVTVSWSVRTEGDDLDPVPLSGVSYSSHRKNKDGTYNISSQVTITPDLPEPASVYTCEVAHIALAEPIHVSVQLQRPIGEEEGILFSISGIVISSILFLLALVHFCRRTPRPAGPTDGTR